jgi:adenylate cyclase
MVEELAGMDEPLGDGRNQNVAVLFADIVDFTPLSHRHTGTEIFALLREVLGLMANCVFLHHGTVDKYLGDGIMATFGTPKSTPADAANALNCGRSMLDNLAAWNRARIASGKEPVETGIGIHFGPVVLGDIGDEHRLEYAVIGDTVNIASRIERITRDLQVRMIATDDLVQAASAFDESDSVKHELEIAPPQTVRGVDEPLAVWTLGSVAPAAPADGA